jgi:hypothetical protein
MVGGTSGSSTWHDLAISGTDIFIPNTTTGDLNEYNTSGELLDATLVTGLTSDPYDDITIMPEAIPEPSTWALVVISAGLLMVFRRRERVKTRPKNRPPSADAGTQSWRS